MRTSARRVPALAPIPVLTLAGCGVGSSDGGDAVSESVLDTWSWAS